MKKQRYHVINTALPNVWTKNCPVQVEKYQIVMDHTTHQLLFRIRLFNNSDHVLHSVYINILCFDDTNDFIGEMQNVALQSIDASPHTSFGDSEILFLSHPNTTHAKISVSKIAFLDGTIWKDIGQTLTFHKPELKKVSIRYKFYQQLERDFKKKGLPLKYMYQEGLAQEYWCCSCGHLNDTPSCHRCGAEQEWLIEHFDESYLSDSSQRFLELQEREAVEQKKKLDAAKHLEDTLERKRKKKNRRILIAIVSFPIVLIILSTIAILLSSIVMPDLYSYYKARYYERTSQTEKAISIYDSLGSYKNSENHLYNNQYKYVQNHLPMENSKAMEYLNELREENYLESEQIYKSVMNWSFEIAITDSETHTTQSALSVSAQDKIYVFITAHNSNPTENISLKVVTQLPGCEEKTLTTQSIQNQDCIRQQYWYNDAGQSGTFTCRIYDSKTDTLLGTASIPVRK